MRILVCGIVVLKREELAHIAVASWEGQESFRFGFGFTQIVLERAWHPVLIAYFELSWVNKCDLLFREPNPICLPAN